MRKNLLKTIISLGMAVLSIILAKSQILNPIPAILVFVISLLSASLYIRKLLILDDNEIKKMLAEAGTRFFNEDTGNAADIYKKILFFRHDNYDALVGLARCYYNDGNYNRALEHLNRAVDLRKDRYEAYYYLGKIHILMKAYKNALISLIKLEELNPDYRDMNFLLGDVYRRMKNYEKAAVYYERQLKNTAQLSLSDKALDMLAQMCVIKFKGRIREEERQQTRHIISIAGRIEQKEKMNEDIVPFSIIHSAEMHKNPKKIKPFSIENQEPSTIILENAEKSNSIKNRFKNILEKNNLVSVNTVSPAENGISNHSSKRYPTNIMESSGEKMMKRSLMLDLSEDNSYMQKVIDSLRLRNNIKSEKDGGSGSLILGQT